MSKKFEKPENISALDDQALDAASDAALDEYNELIKVDDLSDEQLDRIEELKQFILDARAEKGARAEAAEQRAARIAAAKELPADEAEEESEEGREEQPETDEKQPEEGDAEEAEPAEEKEPEAVLASAKPKAPVVRRAGRRPLEPVDEEEEKVRKAKVLAQADVRGFANGQELEGMDGLTQAFINRLQGMPRPTRGVPGQISSYGVGVIEKPAEERFENFGIDTTTSEQEAWNRIMQASRETNLGQSLVAAGGWCAPSVNFYDLCVWETTSGGLDLPTITVTRGGINFTKGPDFASIYTNTGFLQTEAQAIAGTAKTFLEVDCPDWTDIRLDAIGYGVKAPILTASPAGFPELVRRYLEGAAVAHWHKVNAYVIDKVVSYLGAVQNFAELGSASGDLLNAIEVAAQSLRYKFRLGENATLEAMFPMWVKSALRADLARRTGVELLGVTDAQLQAWFTLRGIRPQYVYDWASQELTGTALQFPASVQFGIWPAGAFVKGTNNVISLDAIYDSTEIETNTYTAAFFEEAILVANTCGDGRLFEVALNYAGRTGAADIGLLP